MKLYAQHGASTGDKIRDGISRDVIDGVIFSPRDISLSNLTSELTSLSTNNPNIDLLFDPQLYASFVSSQTEARIGHLDEDYSAYFQTVNRRQLENEHFIREILNSSLRFQSQLPLSSVIAPNIGIPRSCNSIEAVISKCFIRNCSEIARSLEIAIPVYATLAISRDALIDRAELLLFLNDITLLDVRPSGFYVIVESNSLDARNELYSSDVICNWMFINHTLHLNGYSVVNGFSDMLSLPLSITGTEAGATGWWSNLRTFSLDRFSPSMGGGRLPITSYLSNGVLNRLKHFEFNALRTAIPELANNLPSDALYSGEGSEPERNQEVLQSWDALKNALSGINGDIHSRLRIMNARLSAANALYDRIAATPIRLRPESSREHLEPILEGLRQFCNLAEIEFPVQ